MPRNLLLADDSITIQKVIGITFAGEDFTIVTVDNGEDAVRKARELRPDVILADVVMPKKNGYEVCEAIKNDPELSHIPVLLLAGTFEAFDEARARAARADGHIAKPFESQALINKVHELLERDALSDRPMSPNPAGERAGVPARGAAPARGGPAVLDWAAIGFETDAAAQSSAPSGRGSQPIGAAPAPLQSQRQGAVPPAPVSAPPSLQASSRPIAVATPLPTKELLPFGEPIDLADLEVKDPGDLESPPSSSPHPGPPIDDRAGRPAGLRTEPGALEQGRGASDHETLPSRPDPSRSGGKGDAGEAILREALSHASREVIERIAWEVIPALAETIIREHVERLVKEREK